MEASVDRSFAEALAAWSGYYALLGGAGATLLGLQFVAMSLRLNVFRQQEVEDVRDFAIFTFSTFLLAMAIAALALAPHETRRSLATAVSIIGGVGLLAVVWVARVWLRLADGNWESVEGLTTDQRTPLPLNLPPQQTGILRLAGRMTFPADKELESGRNIEDAYVKRLLRQPLEIEFETLGLGNRVTSTLLRCDPAEAPAAAFRVRAAA